MIMTRTMMMTAEGTASDYDTDILLWSERQAELLRRRAAKSLRLGQPRRGDRVYRQDACRRVSSRASCVGEKRAGARVVLSDQAAVALDVGMHERRKSALCPALRRTGGKGPLKVSRADCLLEPGQRMTAYLPQCGVTPRSATPAQANPQRSAAGSTATSSAWPPR